MKYNISMNFEHLIQINDPENPLVETMTRDQLWQGLLHRVEDATPFLPGLESCTILERQGDTLLRELDFGPTVFHDLVTLADMTSMRFDIQPSEVHAGGSMMITIEEPEPGFLFLRFAYQTTLATDPNSEERAYIEYVKSAYHQSDVDCVRIIRTLAAGGQIQ